MPSFLHGDRHWLLASMPALVFAAVTACRGDEPRADPAASEEPAPTGDAAPPADASIDAADSGGGREESDPKSVSGSRLSRELWSGGGASILRTFVDTARGDARCSFMPAEDGVLRCLPLAAGRVEYLDAECTQLAATALAPTDHPRNEMLVETGTACDRRSVVYTLGAPIEVSKRYIRIDTGSCVPAVALAKGEVVRPATAKVPATEFVAGARKVEDGTGRLRRRRVEASDGAWFAESIWDAAVEDGCQLVTDELGVGRCIAGTFFGEWYADAACTALVGSADACGVAPKYGIFRVPDPSSPNAPPALHLRAIGAKHVGSLYRSYPVGGCMDATAGGPRAPLTTTPVDKASFVEAETAFAGAGRIQRQVLRALGTDYAVRFEYSSTGSTYPPSELAWDRELGTYCQLRMVAGETKCMPSGLEGTPVYADAQCTESIVVLFTPETPAPKFMTTRNGADVVVRRVTSSRKLTSYYGMDASTACVALYQGPNEVHAYDLSAPVPLAEFVTFRPNVE